jgi:hypothetical protein
MRFVLKQADPRTLAGLYKYGPATIWISGPSDGTWWATVKFRSQEKDLDARSYEAVMNKATRWIDDAPELSRRDPASGGANRTRRGASEPKRDQLNANPLSGPRKDARDRAIAKAVAAARRSGEDYSVWMSEQGRFHVAQAGTAPWESTIAVAHETTGHLSYKRYESKARPKPVRSSKNPGASRDPKRPGFYVQAPLEPYHEDITSQARWALGLGRETRYPQNLETLHATLPSGMKVRLLRKPARSSRGAHRTSDRLQAYCEYCGKWFGTGNIDQHQIVHGVGSERQLQRYEQLKSRGYPASLKRHQSQMKTWKVYWAPEGRVIATVVAKDAKAAIRKAPQPYRKYLGEMYAEEV